MVKIQKYLITNISMLFLSFLISFSFINQSSLDTTVFAQTSNNSVIDENRPNTDKINYLLTQSEVVGIVKNGIFIEAETKIPLKLTDVHMQEARTPESGLLNLTQYEGKAIMVSTQRADGEWVWGAEVTEVASPLLTKVIKKVFTLQ
jgi:hypothetical protein